MKKYKLYFRLHILYLALAVIFAYAGVIIYNVCPNDSMAFFFFISVMILFIVSWIMKGVSLSKLDDLRDEDLK